MSPGPEVESATIDQIRQHRDDILRAASLRQAVNVAMLQVRPVGSGTELAFVADFQSNATLLDQIGLSLDLTDLLRITVRVHSRHALSEREPQLLTRQVSI